MPNPRKRFGQHFLACPATVARILQLISPQANDNMLEIGPGTGVLTDALINKIGKVIAIEIDRDLSAALITRYTPEQLKLHIGDVLKVDFTTLHRDKPIRLVGNLPYNISTPLLFHLFAAIDCIQDMHFMLQLETAQRLIAEPGSKDYSRLSVMAAYYVNVELLFTVGAEAFLPPPKVTSAFVRLTPYSRPRPTEECQQLNNLVAFAFTHRRKQLKTIFTGKLDTQKFTALGINPQARVETLMLKDFLGMLKYIMYEQ